VRDAIPPHADIGSHPWIAGAIDHAAAAQNQVERLVVLRDGWRRRQHERH
jgi:hypothetical protein